jgi:hypothetical protein
VIEWKTRHNREIEWPEGHLGYCHYSNKGQVYINLSSIEALIEVYLILSTKKLQTLRHEYSWDTKILNAEYKAARLDNIIRTCEHPHVEGKDQFKK